MWIFNWIRGKRDKAVDEQRQRLNLAFVLLSEARMPGVHAVADAFASFSAPDDSLLGESQNEKDGEQEKVLSLRLSSGGSCMLALMPMAVPNGEADRGAEFSLSSFRDGWKLPPHCAHLIVTYHDQTGVTPLVSVSRFTSILAAITEASPSVGVYWGGSGATHDSEFFVSVARDHAVVPRIMVWTGVSVARESDGRLSLLSLGMAQLSLPNLLFVSGPETESSAVEVMFDLLAYVTERGEPIGDGETIGMSAEQRLSVRYVPSPLDPSVKVWRVEFP